MKKKLIIIILCIAILLIGAGVGIYFINSNNSNNKNSNNEKEKIEKSNKENSINTKYFEEKEDESFVNISEDVPKEHSSTDISSNNMNITVGADSSDLADFSFVLKNNTGQTINTSNVSVVFILSDETKFVTDISVNKELAPGESVEIKDQTLVKVISAVDYEIRINPTN